MYILTTGLSLKCKEIKNACHWIDKRRKKGVRWYIQVTWLCVQTGLGKNVANFHKMQKKYMMCYYIRFLFDDIFFLVHVIVV